MTVTSFSLRTSIFIELTATVPISLIDHEDEDAGDPFPCCASARRSAPHHQRRRSEPRFALTGGVAPVVLVGGIHDYDVPAALHQLLWQLVGELHELPAE